MGLRESELAGHRSPVLEQNLEGERPRQVDLLHEGGHENGVVQIVEGNEVAILEADVQASLVAYE
jgi:hypothetical protein